MSDREYRGFKFSNQCPLIRLAKVDWILGKALGSKWVVNYLKSAVN